ncbi:uncharacterized protein HKW66_Vig0173750 [Vigna angularis]|uniref:Uncharacterized protein n=1 Tax=Phaseolus angularis TaxID=3914 RepID=A0A8T0JPH3_PHAAN|nr:uncharacterized protein HKW66_Vig0173750 [Vigna angularis]
MNCKGGKSCWKSEEGMKEKQYFCERRKDDEVRVEGREKVPPCRHKNPKPTTCKPRAEEPPSSPSNRAVIVERENQSHYYKLVYMHQNTRFCYEGMVEKKIPLFASSDYQSAMDTRPKPWKTLSINLTQEVELRKLFGI